MSRCALVLLCLGALSVTVNADSVQTIYVSSGRDVEIGERDTDKYDDVTKCILKTNNGTQIQMYPRIDAHEHYYRRFYMYDYERCRTYIDQITKEDSGRWIMESTVTTKAGLNTKVSQYDIKVRQVFTEKAAVPTTTFRVYPNQNILLQFNEDVNNLDSCKIIDSQNVEYDVGSGKSANIKLAGQCGVIITSRKEYAGKWTLIADLNNGTAYYAHFNIIIKDVVDLNPYQASVKLTRGREGTINGGRMMEHAKMCILEDPHGVKLPIFSGPCNYNIDEVNTYHDGVWKAYYGLEGMEELVQQNIVVVTEDLETERLKSTITRSKNGDINLLCQIRSHQMKFCSFEKPNNEVLHMTVGVGNSKYSYYGKGSSNNRQVSNDCGITIHNPNNDDYGAWKCLIQIDRDSKTYGKILKVNPLTGRGNTDTKSIVKANDVYVKRGESYEVKCKTDEILSYCWLRSPNGTVHTVVENNEANLPSLVYSGAGLELGDCTAKVNVANKTDAGQWTCHMGVTDGPELKTTFNVIVQDSHLMPDQNVIVFDKTKTDLICRPFPNSGKVIESCHWINPAGRGINVAQDGPYVTEAGPTHCKLSILGINFEEDMGEWSCYARFSDSSEEDSARIVLTYRTLSLASFLSIGLAISLLACTSIGLFVIFLYKRRLAAVQHEKIIQEKPPKYP